MFQTSLAALILARAVSRVKGTRLLAHPRPIERPRSDAVLFLPAPQAISQTQFRKTWMLIGTRAKRPMIFTIRLANPPIENRVSARRRSSHETVFIKFPILVSLGPATESWYELISEFPY